MEGRKGGELKDRSVEGAVENSWEEGKEGKGGRKGGNSITEMIENLIIEKGR